MWHVISLAFTLFALEAQMLWNFAKIKEKLVLEIQSLKDNKASTDELRKVASETRDKMEVGLEGIRNSITELDKKVSIIQYKLDERNK